MAIDTAAKRSSALDHEEVWQWGTPLPDGTIGQGDRQHSIWSYSGILATAAAAVAIESPRLRRVLATDDRIMRTMSVDDRIRRHESSADDRLRRATET